jgi:GlpG protein
MRMIGQISTEDDARLFTDYLFVKGIRCEMESERDGSWMIWVLGEDDLESASGYLGKFQATPRDPEFDSLARQAEDLRRQVQLEDEKAAKRQFLRQDVFRSTAYGMGRATKVLIGLCVLVWAAREFGSNKDFWNFLFISNYRSGLPEIRDGQIWRLITPILVHAPMPMILHLIFNLLWLKDLGSMVEARQGALRLLLLVVAISIPSNLAQYVMTGPAFCGMSGVVYGLLGYIWVKGKFDPGSGYFLHPNTMAFMMIWFVACLVIIPGIANWVHGVGLAVGLAAGYLSALRASR